MMEKGGYKCLKEFIHFSGFQGISLINPNWRCECVLLRFPASADLDITHKTEPIYVPGKGIEGVSSQGNGDAVA